MWNESALKSGCVVALLLAFGPRTAAGSAPPNSGPAEDLRVVLAEQQIARDHPAALAIVEEALAADPVTARTLGLEYLQGRLLLLDGRRQEALEAFVAAMGSAPSLKPFSRYRLAVEQAAQGHPETAAGLLAALLGSAPPRSLVAPAIELLEKTLGLGGDCRLLKGLDPARWSAANRRRLELARARCAGRGGDPTTTDRLYRELLEEDRRDGVARAAAEDLAAANLGKRTARTHLLLGLTFHNHREFKQATHHLARALVQLSTATDISGREDFECRYALARSHFWLGRYEAAAAAFEALARITPSSELRAQVLYQQGRSAELAGGLEAASELFLKAYRTAPRSRSWADAALISRLRLEWLRGEEAAALEAFQGLLTHRRHTTAARALLFLASSDLVRGREDRAGDWLASAARLSDPPRQGVRYWQGRLAEIRQRPEEAATHYAEILGTDLYHPFAAAARHRLRDGATAAAGRRVGRRLSSSRRPGELYQAWLLLGVSGAEGRQVRRALEEVLESDAAAAPFLRLAPEPPSRWPLWQATLDRPEEMLLALGIFDDGAPMVLRHFPVAEPTLAFTGSLALARAGETRHSLYIAEILAERIPQALPSQLLAVSYQQLLFPLRYRPLIERESTARGVDPFLLAAIIREESRFDPRAFSSASARGLTQFVYPTARRIAEKIGLGSISPDDLENPETAITLGAAYLQELLQEFGGEVHQAIAAYNAGEPQAELWRRYCYSDEREEYLTKVAFRQTRSYLAKVLTSREHYGELYGRSPSGE